MKKFLFTLAALFTFAGIQAQDQVCQFYVENFYGQKGAIEVPVYMHLEGAAISAFTVDIQMPEGITIDGDAEALDGMTLSYYTNRGKAATVTPTLNQNADVDGNQRHGRYIVANSQAGYYDVDGTWTLYGPVKWLPAEEDYEMFLLYLVVDDSFETGAITFAVQPSCGADARPEVTTWTKGYVPEANVVNIAPAAQPAPVPTLTWDEETFTMTAACTGHQVVLMIGDQVVENPYTVAQTLENQEITFTAYTVANADESANSGNVEQTVTVPARQATYAPAPKFREADGKVYAEAEGYTVVLMLGDEEVDNPYTLPAANYEADQTFNFTAYTVKANEDYNSATVEYSTTVKKLEKNTPTDPVISTETTDDAVIVTVTPDAATDGQLVYDGQPSYARGEQDYEVTVTAYTTEGATYKASGVTTKTFTVPALEQVTPPEPGEGNIYVKFNGTELPVGKKIIFVYENGENSLAMGTVGTKGAPVAVVVANGEVNIANTEVVEFTVGGGEVAFGTDIKQYTLEYSAGFLAYNSSTNFKTLTSVGTYDTEAYWRLQTGDNGYVLNNASTASRYIRKHATNNNFGPYAKSTDSEEVVIYVEKTDAPALQDLTGKIVVSEPDANGIVTVTYTGDEDVTITVNGEPVAESYQLVDGVPMTFNVVVTADGYNDLTAEETRTWNKPVPTETTLAPAIAATPGDKSYTVTVTNNVNEPDAVIYVKVDNGDYVVYTGPITFDSDDFGTHTVSAYAVAPGKNQSNSVSVTFTVDENTKPDPSAVSELNGEKAVAGVRYFNMAGQEMQEANGMTIVVTTYTDGTTSAVKVMK